MATHVLPPPPRPAPLSAVKSGLATPPDTTNIYQTTNPIIPLEPETILSVAKMERAVVSVKGKNALKGLWRETWETNEVAGSRLWRWGCAGQGSGVLGPLQGAGALKPSNTHDESDGKDNLPKDARNLDMWFIRALWYSALGGMCSEWS
ncbi:hypothetical protein QCA50_008672 [Cerrena zonata]|uniref:Uncharacterized protein n=1 Tax=Cerrena zonata TaxID=2478898 RepID=A0AAW0G663_9APHY